MFVINAGTWAEFMLLFEFLWRFLDSRSLCVCLQLCFDYVCISENTGLGPYKAGIENFTGVFEALHAVSVYFKMLS